MPRAACKTTSQPGLDARNELISANLALVRSIAKRISNTLPPQFELDDLISSGYLGLITAATRYQPDAHNGTPFSAYARPVIHGAIIDSVRRGAYVENTRVSASWSGAHEGERRAAVPEPAIVPELEADLDGRAKARRVAAAVSALPRRHARVVKLHYGRDELRLAAIAPKLRVGKSRASQLHMEAVRGLRLRLAS